MFQRLEIAFDCDCFAGTLKKAALGPPLAVEVLLAQDLQLMQSARSERGFLILEAPERNLKNKKKQSARTWTVHFVCLADRYQCKIPSATEKQTLHKAGLGVKKIKLQLDDDETSVHGKLISGVKDDAGDMKGFSQLQEAGGFEMLHCLPNCRDPQVFLGGQRTEMQPRRTVKDLSQTNSKKFVQQISSSRKFL